MAMNTYNDIRETHRQAYGAWLEVRYAMRRYIHFYILGLLPVVLLAPAAWYAWLPLMGFLYILDTDRKVRMQDPFGRGKGPYMKKKAGLMSGQIEEWSVISTPIHRGGDGIWPLGNNIHTNEEIWASDDYVRTHAVLSGTTGSGKTVTMSSTFIYVAMIADSGVIMIDGKADPKTWFELYAMAVAAGRTDDFLVLNFVVGQTQEAEFTLSSAEEKEMWEEFQAIESNTFNIFGTGTSDTLFEIGSALLGAEASGDNKMWVERAEALLRSLLKALVDLRDLGQLKISIATLQEYMSLEKLSELEANEDISEIARQQVGAVLNEIAGYRDAMKVEDPQKRASLLADQPSKQFAFLHMQFGALYAMLIGTYGHIANVEYSDIWAPDVIRNRRILLVMLPALEKAPTSLAQLGRMATSAIKSALAQNISGSLTGRKSELVDRRPTNSTRAMVLIYDEAASYIQAGTADVASQSRSLGAFNIFSSQEWGSLKNAGEIEAQRIISNTGLKIVLKNEDKDTADQFMAAVGEAPILKSGGKRHENGKLVESEQRLENAPRVTFQEMMNMAEGQAFIKWRDTLIHARMPFVPHPKIKAAQRNDLVPIPGAMANDRVKMRLSYARADDVVQSHIPPVDLVQSLVGLFEREEDKDLKPQYVLLEKIVRSSFSHQIVIPWKEAPPPRGKVKATEIFTFEPCYLATSLTRTMELSKEHPLIGRLLDLHKKPDDRFAMPFMPHEAGMIAGGFEEDPDVAQAREQVDGLQEDVDQLNALLGAEDDDTVKDGEGTDESVANDSNAALGDDIVIQATTPSPSMDDLQAEDDADEDTDDYDTIVDDDDSNEGEFDENTSESSQNEGDSASAFTPLTGNTGGFDAFLTASTDDEGVETPATAPDHDDQADQEVAGVPQWEAENLEQAASASLSQTTDSEAHVATEQSDAKEAPSPSETSDEASFGLSDPIMANAFLEAGLSPQDLSQHAETPATEEETALKLTSLIKPAASTPGQRDSIKQDEADVHDSNDLAKSDMTDAALPSSHSENDWADLHESPFGYADDADDEEDDETPVRQPETELPTAPAAPQESGTDRNDADVRREAIKGLTNHLRQRHGALKLQPRTPFDLRQQEPSEDADNSA